MTSSPRRLLLVGGALLVVMAGLLLVLLRQDDEALVDRDLVAVARTAATDFYSLDHRHVEADTARFAQLTAGALRRAYAESRAATVRRVTKNQLVVTARVPDGAVAVAHRAGERAVALVVVDAHSASRGATDDQRHRLRLELVRDGEAWLVSGLTEIGAGSEPGVDRPDGEAGAAVAAASRVLARAFGYDHRSLDDGLDEARSGMTAGFGKEFARTFTKVVVPSASRQRAIATAKVLAAGVVRMDDERAVVLGYLDQALAAGKPTPSAVTVSLRRQDGRWLVDGFEPIAQR